MRASRAVGSGEHANEDDRALGTCRISAVTLAVLAARAAAPADRPADANDADDAEVRPGTLERFTRPRGDKAATSASTREAQNHPS
jgi:hypothetical protein